LLARIGALAVHGHAVRTGDAPYDHQPLVPFLEQPDVLAAAGPDRLNEAPAFGELRQLIAR
jgi:hypothetical protein